MESLGLLFFLVIVILSAIIHEYAHGWMADRLGDSTAKYAGRLTLNPVAHIDMFGTILMPLFLYFISGGAFLFGYAKPVPVNPYNLRDQKYGTAKVAFAGPAANLMTALVFGLLIRLLPASSFTLILGIIVYVNILLAVFNLVPLPPLDGSKILFALLPDSWDNVRMFLTQYGFIILLIFIVFAFKLILPIIFWLYYLIAGQSLLF